MQVIKKELTPCFEKVIELQLPLIEKYEIFWHVNQILKNTAKYESARKAKPYIKKEMERTLLNKIYYNIFLPFAKEYVKQFENIEKDLEYLIALTGMQVVFGYLTKTIYGKPIIEGRKLTRTWQKKWRAILHKAVKGYKFCTHIILETNHTNRKVAWETFQYFVTRFKQKLPKNCIITSRLEGHKNGFPHAHILLISKYFIRKSDIPKTPLSITIKYCWNNIHKPINYITKTIDNLLSYTYSLHKKLILKYLPPETKQFIQFIQQVYKLKKLNLFSPYHQPLSSM